MVKKFFILFFGIFIFLFLADKGLAQTEKQVVNLYFFWGNGCPHCTKEKTFLEEFKKEYSQVNVYSYEIYFNQKNQELMQKVGNELNIDIRGVPLTIIGDKAISGFGGENTTGKEITERVLYCLENECTDKVGSIAGVSKPVRNDPSPTPEATPVVSVTQVPVTPTAVVEGEKTGNDPSSDYPTVNVPFIGQVNTKSLSLPVLTILIGGLDGFNPCAMWVLVFLIGLLIGMNDRKRMWILGGAFIAASAFVYFLFMAAWLNLILFVGVLLIVRLAIAGIAVAGGIYNIREYFVNKDGACKVTGGEKRQKIFNQLKQLTHEKRFLVALGGIILLAFAVNLVELICSAGFPVVYTQVLALNNLPVWQYYMYLALYVFVFMLDDLIVFFLAMKTLQLTGLTTKYTRYSHLIGGILMVIIGILLVLKPELLMFG
jgi:glutaredoxin